MAKIGLIQVDNYMEYNIQARQDALYALAEACLRDGADLVFFPEAFQYVGNRQVAQDKPLLDSLNDAWKKRCAELAKKYHAYVVPWDYRIEDGKLYNLSYILNREGVEIGSYRKCNLTVSELENGISNGMEYPVFDLDFGKVGIIICFDNYYPESVASLANQGAQLVLYPLYGDTLKPQWELKLRARAADHSLYMASSQLDILYDTAYTGLVDPEGNVITKLEAKNTWKVVDVDLDRRVLTNTLVIPGRTEDLREYLHKCRNYRAFSGLASEGTKPLEWTEIIHNGAEAQ